MLRWCIREEQATKQNRIFETPKKEVEQTHSADNVLEETFFEKRKKINEPQNKDTAQFYNWLEGSLCQIFELTCEQMSGISYDFFFHSK